MKYKKIILIIILIIILVLIGGAIIFLVPKKTEDVDNKNVSNIEETTAKIDLKIRDAYFLTNMDDIYLNYKEYEGKTISYEGFVAYPENSEKMVVARYFYCCGTDSYIVGLEAKYDGDKLQADQWVEVIGVIELGKNASDKMYPYLKVTDLKVLEKEGNKYVNN